MPNWSRREALGSVASCVGVVIAGCVGDGSEDGLDQPEYDCSRVDRPEPDAPEGPDALAPSSYPRPPADAGTDAELTEYVSDFEQSYRRNRLIQSRGPDLRKFGFSPREIWIVESGAAAGVAGVQYTFWHETESIHADSGNRVAVYYVDESVAIRAHERGRREDGVEPDPRETGQEVACFE
jgi:hypothetical protein